MRDRARAAGVLLLFFLCGYLIAPFAYGDKRVLVPPGQDLDAVQQSLLLARGVDKLTNAPRSYFDTDILYPDRNQLRTTEPLLGFALLGLPVRAALHPNDADLFDVVRWTIVVASLVYGYLFFRSVDVEASIAVAGAMLCVGQPGLLNGIERLQIVSIPLLFPVLYYWTRLWQTGERRHRVGLFAFAALYPLCGVINATVLAVAVLLVIPSALTALRTGETRRRLVTCVVPIALAAGLDALLLGPWLLDRSDLNVYVTDAFLQVKHWNTAALPASALGLPGFVTARLGVGAVAALVALGTTSFVRRVRGETRHESLTSLWILSAAAIGLSLAASSTSLRLLLPSFRIGFQILCYATLLLYWRRQVRSTSSGVHPSHANVAMLSAGVGVFLCLLSFGPAYASNSNPVATHIMRVLLTAVPPLKAIREFDRIWLVGILFLSIFATVRLSTALRACTTTMSVATATVVAVATLSAVYTRPLAASADIEAPRDFMALASHSRGMHGIYVHPYMKWNSWSGVWMIPIARDLKRPIVNGYLGIAPPWFDPAGRVLHRFPDPEALWLLRTWTVDTVVSLSGNVRGEDAAGVEKVFENGSGVVYEVAPFAGETPHPSKQDCLAPDARVKVDGALSPLTRGPDGASVVATVPTGFSVKRMQVIFRPSAIEQIPESIDVYALEGSDRVRLNQQRSGQWIPSLLADALVRRMPLVATIAIGQSSRSEFQVAFQRANAPPLEGITFCGEWSR